QCPEEKRVVSTGISGETSCNQILARFLFVKSPTKDLTVLYSPLRPVSPKRPASDKVAVHKLSHLEHRDNLLAVEYRQESFVCADVALFLGILELVFADVLPKLFGQFGPGEWVFADHCGQCGVGLHGFAKGFLGGGGFLRGRHRAIRTLRAWLPSEKSTVFQGLAGAPRRNSADSPGTVHSRADLLRQILMTLRARCF